MSVAFSVDTIDNESTVKEHPGSIDVKNLDRPESEKSETDHVPRPRPIRYTQREERLKTMLEDLVAQCCHDDPAQRPTAAQLKRLITIEQSNEQTAKTSAM